MPSRKGARKVVLAYSGGAGYVGGNALGWWSGAGRWSGLTVDVGFQGEDSDLERRALAAGASKLILEDARETFAHSFIFPALMAGALYEGRYPLATALARPLIAKVLVDRARAEGAGAVAHGCTGKGNDQVRFDVSVGALAPELRILAPGREWELTTRASEIVLRAGAHTFR